jgi:hypothetical protein
MFRRFFMAFKVVPSKKDIEQFIEKFIERKLKETRIEERVNELRRVLGLDKKGAKAVAAVPAPPRVEAKHEAVPAPRKVVAPPEPAPTPEPVPAKKAAAKKPAAKKAAAKKAPAAKKPAAKKAAAPAADGGDPLTAVLAALDARANKADLIDAGKQKDQLLRSLIPLYVAQGLEVEVSSGVASKFWAKHGVKFAAPNAAKVLREHAGYAKRTPKGPRISAAGVKYVEAALAPK